MADSPDNAATIEKILQDPLLLQRLSEQVYQLLLQDIVIQRDRTPNP
jgi:hypothetical protein